MNISTSGPILCPGSSSAAASMDLGDGCGRLITTGSMAGNIDIESNSSFTNSHRTSAIAAGVHSSKAFDGYIAYNGEISTPIKHRISNSRCSVGFSFNTETVVECSLLSNIFQLAVREVASKVSVCREEQLIMLVQFLGLLQNPLPIIQVVGPAGSGKTMLIRNFMEHCQICHSYTAASPAAAVGGNMGRNSIYFLSTRSLCSALRAEVDECGAAVQVDLTYLRTKLQEMRALHAAEHEDNGDDSKTLNKVYEELGNLQDVIGAAVNSFRTESRKAIEARISLPDPFVLLVHEMLVNSTAVLMKIAAVAASAASVVALAAAEADEGDTYGALFLQQRNFLKHTMNTWERSTRAVPLVWDDADVLTEKFPELMYALLRLDEFLEFPSGRRPDVEIPGNVTELKSVVSAVAAGAGSEWCRGVCVLLVGRNTLTQDILANVPPPPVLPFHPYDKSSAAFLLYRSFRSLGLPLLKHAMVRAGSGFPYSLAYIKGTVIDEKLLQEGCRGKLVQEGAHVYIVRKNDVDSMTQEIGMERIDAHSVWQEFTSDLTRVFYSTVGGDFRELRFLCREFWCQAVGQFISTRKPSKISMHNEIIRNNCAAASMRPYTRLVSDLYDCRVSSHLSTTLWGSRLVSNAAAAQSICLPEPALQLLVAAFLAAYTPRVNDKRRFEETFGTNLFTLGKRRRRVVPNTGGNYSGGVPIFLNWDEHIIPMSAPKPFDLMRWFGLAEMVGRQAKVLCSATLYKHSATLMRLGLVGLQNPSTSRLLYTDEVKWVHEPGWVFKKGRDALRFSTTATTNFNAKLISHGCRGGGSCASVSGGDTAAQVVHHSAIKLVLLAEVQLAVQAAKMLGIQVRKLLEDIVG